MKPDIRPPAADEPAVHSPQLRALVELAREATPPPLRVDADRVHAGTLAARHVRAPRNGIIRRGSGAELRTDRRVIG